MDGGGKVERDSLHQRFVAKILYPDRQKIRHCLQTPTKAEGRKFYVNLFTLLERKGTKATGIF